ncbi:hypothetical protein, partial [Pseudomonas aeruginosa]|uniref:hypothetical protein n=1 Tax=Pseudomonas aeruginosa TaxID=287 RepID=UPI0023DCB630
DRYHVSMKPVSQAQSIVPGQNEIQPPPKRQWVIREIATKDEVGEPFDNQPDAEDECLRLNQENLRRMREGG